MRLLTCTISESQAREYTNKEHLYDSFIKEFRDVIRESRKH